MSQENPQVSAELVRRSVSYVNIYIQALGKVKNVISGLNRESGAHTHYGPESDLTGSDAEMDSGQVLGADLSDEEFESRMALEAHEVEQLLHEFLYTMEAVSALFNKGYQEIASDFDVEFQLEKLRPELDSWQRWIPFYARYQARKMVRKHFLRTDKMASFRMLELYNQYLMHCKKKRKKPR